MKRTIIPLVMAVLFITSFAHSQLPVWPLATRFPQAGAGNNTTGLTPHQYVDWTVVNPASTNIPAVGGNPAESNLWGQTQAGINGCNELVFFAIHNGVTAQATAALEIYTPAGDYLALPGGDMNANAGDDEVQVVRRPGFPNQWFVIYSLAPASWPSGHPAYQASLLAYSLIEVNSTSAVYVLDGFGMPIQDREIQVAGTSLRYFHGKAVSRTSVTLGANAHDLYVQRRTHNLGTTISDTDFEIDRFNITSSTDITYEGSSFTTTSYAWSLMVSGSPIELSPTENTLAVMARTEIDNQQEIYLFDPNAFVGSVATTIAINDLWLEFPAPLPTLGPGLFHQANEFNTSAGTGVDWLRNFERKVSKIEFSPNGNYLYFTSGGFVAGFNTNLTYLAQIDLTTTMGPNNDHVARFHVQTTDPGNSFNLTSGGGPTWSNANLTNLWDWHPIVGLQTSFDGNLYFTKSHSEQLWVYPNPDAQMITDPLPQDLDYGTVATPNIPTDGYVLFMPDQIDGFDYSISGYESVSFNISNQSLCNCEDISIDVVNSNTGDVITTLNITECPTTVSLCIEDGESYDLVGSNGMVFENAVNLGSVVYPVGTNMFNFGNGGAVNTSFVTVTNPNITSDEVWEGHYFIPDNMIVVVSGATLDLTNVDLVFGECAGIDFIDGSILRANNSVLRPCEMDGVWRGLDFDQLSATGAPPIAIINECTFKNAQIAIDVLSMPNMDIRVTNNLFSNCKAGVSLNTGNFLRSITGNTFILDDLVPIFDGLQCSWGVVGEYYGILGRRITYFESIAQNDFVAPFFKAVNFTGIESIQSRGITIQSNNFSNNFKSIHLERDKPASIESNEIEVSDNYSGFEHQIAVVNCTDVLVSHNNIVNTAQHQYTSWAGNNSGIYFNLGTTFDIKENYVEGFETGIQCENARFLNITDNEINNCYFYGIYLNRPRTVSVSCNTINMELQNNNDAIGIGYFTTFVPSFSNEIRSNCIFETNTAMHFRGLGVPSSNLPLIENNYMYNYNEFGVEAINMVGNIGSSPSPALGAGRNTFVSNNGLGLTADIASTNPLTSFGNYGVSFVSGTISLAGNNVNSTASCGHQIDLANSSSGYTEICDDLSGTIGILVDNGGLAPGFHQHIKDASFDELNYAMFRLSDINEMELATFHDAVVNSERLEGNEAQWFDYNYFSLIEEKAMALNTLSAIQPENSEEADLKTIERVATETELTLNGTQIAELEGIYASESRYAHAAKGLLFEYGVSDTRDYYATLKAAHVEGVELIAVESTSFAVYPNPTEGVIQFEYSLEENVEAILVIYDMTGKQVASIDLDYQHSTQTANVDYLPEGFYTLSVQSNNQVVAHSKFVKL